MIQLILSTFGIIFVAELADKTALASLVLASRLPARSVIVGAWLAFLVQTGVAVAAGSLLQLLPEEPIRLAAGASFLIFAALALREGGDDGEDGGGSKGNAGQHRAAWITSFLVVFAAEWGDLTQLATVALVARTGKPLAVAIGATTGEWAVALLAVLAGSRLSKLLNPKLLSRASAALFAAIGLFIIITTLLGGG
ncbi:MAG: TMEM165/GDT1 family protein [Chloroflexota bacterium]